VLQFRLDPRFALAIRELAKINNVQGKRPLLRDFLDWASVYDRKVCAQDFMTMTQPIETLFQSPGIKISNHSMCVEDIERHASGLKLVKKPEPLLRERERQLDISRDRR
jgi:hypothetical protein